MRLLNWNLEFGPPGGNRAKAIAATIEHHQPAVVCLTETHTTWPMEDGHWIWAQADYGYANSGDRRKVGLWSRAPWASLVTSHPLVDGNKRLGWLATAVLLRINGVPAEHADNEAVYEVDSVADALHHLVMADRG